MFTPALRNSPPECVVVDEFYANPDEVRAFALQQEYQEDKRYFRGQRSKGRFLFPGLKERFGELLGMQVTKWEEYPVNGVFQFCVGGDQTVFHSDQQKYAAVVYLTPDAPPEAGTRLLRSKETKLRIVTPVAAARIGMSLNMAEQRTYGGKLLDPTAWETVDSIGNVYNRLVLWHAHLIHAAGHYFGTDINNGRLFQLFFFDAEVKT